MYDCEISNNSTTGVGTIYCYDPAGGTDMPKSLYMANCEITGNTAGSYGGGVYARSSSAVLVNCTIHGNTARNGAGVMSYGEGGAVTLISCTVTGNNLLVVRQVLWRQIAVRHISTTL